MTTIQKVYENQKHGIQVTSTETEYFGLFLKVKRDGITAYEGQTSWKFLDRIVRDLELKKVSEERS